MNDAEISYQLAIAIGYSDDVDDPDVQIVNHIFEKRSYCEVWFDGKWREFDYKKPDVIWPIAVEHKAFPSYGEEGWHVRLREWLQRKFQATPEKAVAMAVINDRSMRRLNNTLAARYEQGGARFEDLVPCHP